MTLDFTTFCVSEMRQNRWLQGCDTNPIHIRESSGHQVLNDKKGCRGTLN